MKVIIAGGRDFEDYQFLEDTLWDLYGDRDYGLRDVTEIVQGGARGADALGSQFAEVHNLPEREFPADWDKHGKRAGYLRNEEMAEYADVLIAFWDGESRGTRHMIQTALAAGLEVHVYRYINEALTDE